MSKEGLLKIIQKQESTLKQKDVTILTQKQWIEQLQRMLFGSKSERFVKVPVDPKQLHLSFEELEEKNNDQKEPNQTVKGLIPTLTPNYRYKLFLFPFLFVRK